MCAQARRPRACSRGAWCSARCTGLPAGALATLRSGCPTLVPLRSSVLPRVTRKFVGIVAVYWREILPTLPSPLSPRRPLRRPNKTAARGGASAGGLKAPSSTPPSPSLIGANRGEGATVGQRAMPARKTRKEPTLYPCLSFPTSSTRERPSGSRPRPASPSLSEFKLSPLPLPLGALSSAVAGARGGGGDCPGRVSAPSSSQPAEPRLQPPPRGPSTFAP